MNNTDRYLTFALGKGRLANKTLELLEKIGITCEEMKDKDSRKLIFVNEELKCRFFLAKATDVPTYVEYGAADIGVVGKDTILEENKKASELGDLIKLYPQVLINAKVNSEKKYDYEEDDDIKNAIDKLEKEFAGNGRVLIRPSGTEPLVRVMIEGENQEYITKKAQDIADLIEQKLK